MVQLSDDASLEDSGARSRSPGPQAAPRNADTERLVEPLAEPGRLFLATLFHKYRGSLYRYLSGLVSSPEDAAELVQESYTRLLEHENVAQLEAVSRSYLFQIA